MPNTTRRPTVGDIVRIINPQNCTYSSELSGGSLHTVTVDTHDTQPYKVSGNKDYWFFERDVEYVAAGTMSDTTKAFEDLKATHAKMAEEIKDPETKITKEAKSKRPELAPGQLWRKHSSPGLGVYIAHRFGDFGRARYSLVALNNRQHGDAWSCGAGFDGDEDDFTYLGMASDLLTIKEPSK